MEEMAEIDTEKEHTHLSKCTEGQDERERDKSHTQSHARPHIRIKRTSPHMETYLHK